MYTVIAGNQFVNNQTRAIWRMIINKKDMNISVLCKDSACQCSDIISLVICGYYDKCFQTDSASNEHISNANKTLNFFPTRIPDSSWEEYEI
jgi:hypothetical protein